MNYQVFNSKRLTEITWFSFVKKGFRKIIKNMRNCRFKILLIGFIYFAFCGGVFALEIIYPSKNPAVINAKSTFFIGNTAVDSKLFINNLPVKVWENGGFVQVEQLVDGENVFSIKSVDEKNNTEELIFKINKPTITDIAVASVEEYLPFETLMLSKVVKDNIPLRNGSNDDATRITHLPLATTLYLEGKKGTYYKVNLNECESVWVSEKYVEMLQPVEKKAISSIESVDFETDSDFDYIKIQLTNRVPFKLTERESDLELTIYDLEKNVDSSCLFQSQKIFEHLILCPSGGDNLVVKIPSVSKLWGYDCTYLGERELVLKRRKQPDISIENPLKNITIAVDAGHGGSESGSVGPTGIKEKDINLDIATRLQKELKASGANVIMTRNTDAYVDLFERVKIAQANNALILISIHSNALPDGGNPYLKHGTSVYFYNKESKELADTLKLRLIKELQTADDGTNKGSLVLARPTFPLSVLIEVAYMIHPVEYQLLLDENFRQNAASAIKLGIEEYLINSSSVAR